jgi:DNA-binding MarR family transcriptional regulator
MAKLREPKTHTGDGDRVLVGVRECVLTMVRGDRRDLSLRQLAVLLTCHTSSVPKTVTGLARELRFQKPTVTRAVDTLVVHKLARRVPDRRDKRSVFIELTQSGRTFCKSLQRNAQP